MSRLPRRKKNQTEKPPEESINLQAPESIRPTNVEHQEPLRNFSMQNIESISLERRMRKRHFADGAVNLILENDDLSNDNISLYDNKEINFEKPKINENISQDKTEYYIESIHHDQFFKIHKESKKEDDTDIKDKRPKHPKKQKRKKAGEPGHRKRPLTSFELSKRAEEKIFNQFDEELTQVINKTTSRVGLLFLFTQGLLAGMALMHIILMFMCGSFDNFIDNYAKMIRESFNIFHTLTFASLVGNGIKFITAYQKYNIIKSRFNSGNLSTFTELRKNMIFSGILLVLFTITFALEIFLCTRIMPINYVKCLVGTVENSDGIPIKINYTEFYNLKTFDGNDVKKIEIVEVLRQKTESDLINSSKYKIFKTIFIVADIIVILLFILNIFDVTLKSDSEKIVKPTVNVNYYLNEMEDTREDEDDENEEY